jgi:AraC-like DNA-binding protein
MNSQEIAEVMHARLLPRLSGNDYNLLPSPAAQVANSKSYEPIFPWGYHKHSFFEWCWCVENHSFLKIQDTVYRLEEGDFCLLPPSLLHSDVYVPALNSFKLLSCSYREEILSARLHTYIPVNHLPFTSEILVSAPPIIPSLLTALQTEMHSNYNYREEICYSLVATLLKYMLRSFEEYLHRDEEMWITGNLTVRVKEYLQQHYHRPLTQTEIAKRLRVSRNYLATTYKQQTGKTIGQDLTQIRLLHAKKLLLEEQLPVKDIAKMVGFTSAEHFSRMFLRYEGITPGKYGK